MTLDVALESLTLGYAAYVNLIANCEHIGNFDLLAEAVLLVGCELADNSLRLNVSLLELSCVRLVYKLCSDGTCAYFAGLVSVSLYRLVLEHVHRLAAYNGCRNNVTVVIEQLCHAGLSANDEFRHKVLSSYLGYWFNGFPRT